MDNFQNCDSYITVGYDVAQTIGLRLPTAAAEARARFRICGICGAQCGTGVGLLSVLRIRLPSIPPIAPHSSSSSSSLSGADTVGHLMDPVLVGSVPLHP
jgi:hypothetical protein